MSESASQTEPMTAEPAQQTAVPSSRRDWRAELRHTIESIPNKAAFGILLLAWVLLFQFFGNSTQGYVKTPSLFAWLSFVYDSSTDDRHGYMIPFAVLGLLWWKRSELAKAPTRFWWPATGVIAAGILIHLAGFAAQQSQVSVGGFFFGLWGILGLVWGPAVMGGTFFPFVLFLFSVPLSGATSTVTLPLRHLAAAITVKLCNLLSIVVQQNGTNILDPHLRYQYDVAAACSGIRSLTAICALTTAYAFISFTRTWKRILIVALAIPLAVVSNVLRLLTIVFASEIASTLGRSPQAAGQYVHDSTVISLLPYLVGFFGVLLVARWIKEDRDIDIASLAVPVGVGLGSFLLLDWVFHKSFALSFSTIPGQGVLLVPLLAVVLAMLFPLRMSPSPFPKRAIFGMGIALVMMAATSLLIAQRQRWQRLSEPGVKVIPEQLYVSVGTNVFLAGKQSVYLPRRVLTYDSEPLPLSKVVFDGLPKDTTFGQRHYVSPDSNFVDNIVVLMGADRTSIHQPQFCLGSQGFKIVSDETEHIPMARPVDYDLPVRKLKFTGTVTHEGRKQEIGGVFVYWYVSDTQLSAWHGKRVWDTTRELIRTGVMRRWAYVICMTACVPGTEEAAYGRLKEFIQASVPEYQTTVGEPIARRSDATARN